MRSQGLKSRTVSPPERAKGNVEKEASAQNLKKGQVRLQDDDSGLSLSDSNHLNNPLVENALSLQDLIIYSAESHDIEKPMLSTLLPKQAT